jgi:hypothetical protein
MLTAPQLQKQAESKAWQHFQQILIISLDSHLIGDAMYLSKSLNQ